MKLHEIIKKYSVINSGYLVKPQKLYHYTSPEGLIGILSQKSLFFTDSQFLNDSDECKDIYRILKIVIDEIDDTRNPNLFSQIKEFAENAEKNSEYFGTIIQDASTFRFFIASFCMDSDNLSMWNYYTKTANSCGYSICLDWHAVHQRIWDNKDLIQLLPINYYEHESWERPFFNMHGSVIYNDKEKKEILNDLINDILDYEKEAKDSKDPITILENIMHGMGLFFKNESFSNEREYRFVIVSRNQELLKYKNEYPNSNLYDFRLMNGLIIPYINVPLLGFSSVQEVIVSPSIKQEIAIQGLEYFMYHIGYRPRVIKSRIPLRY